MITIKVATPRSRVIDEILATERAYKRDLDILADWYTYTRCDTKERRRKKHTHCRLFVLEFGVSVLLPGCCFRKTCN